MAIFMLHKVKSLRQKLDDLESLNYLLSGSLLKKTADPWFPLLISHLISVSWAGPP